MAGPPHKTKLIVTVRNFAKAPKNPCSLPKDDEVSWIYMDLYSEAWSACVETDSIKLTEVTGRDGLPHSE